MKIIILGHVYLSHVARKVKQIKHLLACPQPRISRITKETVHKFDNYFDIYFEFYEFCQVTFANFTGIPASLQHARVPIEGHEGSQNLLRELSLPRTMDYQIKWHHLRDNLKNDNDGYSATDLVFA